MTKAPRLSRSPMKKIAVAVLATGLTAGLAGPAAAESNEVRFAQQFGLLYLPMHAVVKVQGRAEQYIQYADLAL